MTPADRRIAELIDKWLASIDLHLQYVELSDAAYSRAQAWPRHDRPTRWVLEVARQKILELKSHCENRQAMGDSKFSEALELMAFLANLVGLQHIQRYIPLADPARTESTAALSQTVEAPPIQAPRSASVGEEATREMPRLKADAKSAARTAAPAAPMPTRPPAAKAPARQSAAAARPAPPAPSKTSPAASDQLTARIVADAVRLLKWGKPWHELAELIARIADRPSAAEIRKVLRANKAEIEQKAAVK
jgi:hypothetical protein